MHRFLVLGLAVTSLCSMSAQAPPAGRPLDWDKLQVEILERDLWAALIDPRVFALALVNFGVLLGAYGVQLWLPQIVQGMGFSNSETGVVVALPYTLAMGAMILWGRSSDRRRERIWHVALPALLAAVGLAIVSMTESDLVSFVALTVAVIGILCANALVFSLPGSFLHGPAAAGGIALIVSISSLGGFLGPTIVGVLKERSGSYASGMAALSLGLVLSAVIVLTLGRAMALRSAMLGPKAGSA
jgi:ACS family tartrate transporter-like MFS transporter